LRTTSSRPSNSEVASSSQPPMPTVDSPSTSPATPLIMTDPVGTTAAPDTDRPEAPRRKPVNPFLSRDPGLRAKRLARALVSDIVAYHPAKHAEGLRDGTLRILFREEIRKSYEE